MLKEIRRRGLSQEQIGQKVGVSQAAISRLMSGATQCNYSQGLKIKQLYETYIPAEKWTEDKAKAKIEDLKRALVVAQGNFDEAQACVQRLEKVINAMKGRRCWLCRVKFFFKG
jgi:transcriptional regulator with XRE-family HTH domain